MAQLTFDLSGRKGLAPRFWGDNDRTTATPQLRILGDEGQMADGIYNPFRRYGYMSPSNATFTSITYSGGTLDALPGSSIYDSVNDDFYFAERGRQIWKGDTLDDTELSMEHDLGATGTPRILDLEIYQINGTRKLFYVYEKSGNMEIGEANLPIASENDNWLTSDVSGSFTNTLTNDAFLRVSDNGFMYIFQDNVVHKVDGTTDGGTNGTVSANQLKFPDTFQIIDAVDYRGNMYIAMHNNTEAKISSGPTVRASTIGCGVYIWNRDTSLTSIKDIIPLQGVKEVRKIYIAPNGELRLIVVNAENITEVRRFVGSAFVPVQEVGYLAYPQFHDSVLNFGGLTTWLGYDGIIYAHGKISPFDSEGIYKIGDLPEAIATSGLATGAILFGGANSGSSSAGNKNFKTGLYVAYKSSGGTFTMKTWDIYGVGADESVNKTKETGNIYNLTKYLPQMSTVENIEIFMAALDTSGSTTEATLKIYLLVLLQNGLLRQ